MGDSRKTPTLSRRAAAVALSRRAYNETRKRLFNCHSTTSITPHTHTAGILYIYDIMHTCDLTTVLIKYNSLPRAQSLGVETFQCTFVSLMVYLTTRLSLLMHLYIGVGVVIEKLDFLIFFVF